MRIVLVCSFVACASAPPPASVAIEPLPAAPPQTPPPAPPMSENPTTAAGSFSLPGLLGAPARLWPAQVNVVAFAASWCMPCVKQFPALDALAKRYHSRGLAVVGLSEDSDAKDFVAFLGQVGSSFPAALDSDSKIAHAWNVSAMPTTFIVDKHGAVRFKHEGFHDGEEIELESQVSALLGE